MVRMPGGSTNTICSRDVLDNIKSYLKTNDISYIDWTIDCGDTRKSLVACNTIRGNVGEMCGKNVVEVVLMHDLENKKTTTEALQDIIDDYKKLALLKNVCPIDASPPSLVLIVTDSPNLKKVHTLCPESFSETVLHPLDWTYRATT